MKVKSFVYSVLSAFVILFLWSGLTQMFPWGVPSTHTLASQTDSTTKIFQGPLEHVKRFPANALTTPAFDSEMTDKVSTLMTDKSFSWIISKPIAYYDPYRYFGREMITQLLVSLLLVAIAHLSRPLPLRRRMALYGFAGGMASFAAYGQLYNWWGLTLTYALGVSVNLTLGWLLAGFVVSRWIVRSGEA